MSDLREAAQIAVEALEADPDDMVEVTKDHWEYKREQAWKILRAALAQPDKSNQCAETCERAKLCAVCASVVDDVNPEPVLWMMPDGKIVDKWALQFYGGQAGEPLYKAPPQRKPLTEEEIDALMPEADGTAETNKVWNKNGDFPYLEYDEVDAWSKLLVIQIVRSAERAHGIGGEE